METALPTPITPFIGRTDEIETITHLIDQASCRLLTLVGPGGAGKTRLAIQAVAQRREPFRDGVYFVPLQAVSSPEAVVYAIAEALNVSLYEQKMPRSQLLQYLQRRRILLILDNFEHLLGAADFINQILEAVPESKMLVTSREVLNLQGEHIFEVGGLAVAGAHSDAIQLFAARSGQVKQDFSLEDHLEAVGRICRLVGGLPLGIELAAAWTRTLSCAEIADEIERNLDFLATGLRDIPERHRSVRAVFEYSWARMSAEEQAVFRCLSVFKGQFNREAIQAVTDAPLSVLSALVDQSLVRVDGGGQYAVHELLRQFALEKLSQDPTELADSRGRHSAYYLNLLRTLEPKLKSGGQIEALDAIEFGLDNVKAAWNYAAEQRRSDLILPSIEPLVLYYQMRCRLQEGLAAFSDAAEYFAVGDETTYGWLLLGQCWFSGFEPTEDMERVTDLTQRVMGMIERHRVFGFGAMMYMALWFTRQERLPDLIARNQEVYQAKGDLWGIAWSKLQMGSYKRHSHKQEAKPLLEEAVALFERIGDRWSATWPEALLGFMAEDEGRYGDAYQLYSTRLKSCEAVGDAGGVAWSLQQIAKVTLLLNDRAKARYYCRESLRVALEIGSGNSVSEAILRIISMYSHTGRSERAAEVCAAMLNHIERNSYGGQRIEQQLEQLKIDLPPEVFSRALEARDTPSIRDLGWALLDELADEPVMITAPGQIETLSERELEVLRLAADGLSNREIADRLVVTLGTIKKHLNNIYGKLGVERRTQAIAQARQQRLIP